MGEKRHPFRFRLPWLSAAANVRPVAPRPAAQTEVPSQPSTANPIQRSPFRPAGTAPVRTTPTQAQAPAQNTEPQSAATSRTASSRRRQIRASSVPPSPSRKVTETQLTSRPVSTSRETSQTQATSQTRSPSRAPTQARAVSVPPAPSRIVSQPESTAHAVSKQQSLSPLPSQPAGQTSPQPSSSLRSTQALTSSTPNRSPTVVQERSQSPSSTQPPSSALKKTQPFGGVVNPSPTSTEVKETSKSESDKGDQQKLEDMGTKKTSTTSSTDEKQIKTVSSTYSKNGSTQNKAHQKQVSSNWEQVPLHKEMKEDISKFVHKLTTEQPKLATEEKTISVVTLAGENRGASFHVDSESSKKDGLVHIRRGYKINPDDSPDTSTDGEESSRGRKPTDSTTKENSASRTYANNNAQSINNSIVFESSVNARNPGVYVEFSYNLVESTKSSSENAENVQPQKAEYNITSAEKLTQKPTVRRRCLRGLFAESSDSDTNNPEKPRRHGCRYSCGGKNKQEGIF